MILFTFAVQAELVDDITGAHCRAGSGSTHTRLFCNSKAFLAFSFLSENQVTNCCISSFGPFLSVVFIMGFLPLVPVKRCDSLQCNVLYMA